MANIKLSAEVLNNRISNQDYSCYDRNNLTTSTTNSYNCSSINTTSGLKNGDIYIQKPNDVFIYDSDIGFTDIKKVKENEVKL